jgi:cytoskeletal protein CcmA (bactofilin family)/DNA-directed RNA polymerase subunit RPC12/RpoP
MRDGTGGAERKDPDVADKRTKMMDGYSVVQSLAKAMQDGVRPSPGAHRAAEDLSSHPPPAALPADSPHIVKTIQPTKRTIRCFKCSYEFQLSGTTKTIYCSKCREKIDLGDYVIDRPWSEEIKTGGSVIIRPTGRLENVRIWAGNVILEGSMDEHSSIECTQWLEIGGQANPHPRQIAMRNLRIAAGASIQFKYKLQVHHLELLGTLEGDVEAAGLVSIREGGHLKGTVRGAHLQVEEGGGLSARVFIWPQGNPMDPET